MRNMSFSLTLPQLLAGLKCVTRRKGWQHAKHGDRLMAVHRTMGFRLGERALALGPIELVSVSRQPLHDIDDEDVAKEGFPGESPESFIQRFCQEGCKPEDIVTRIAFKPVEIDGHLPIGCAVEWDEPSFGPSKGHLIARAPAGPNLHMGRLIHLLQIPTFWTVPDHFGRELTKDHAFVMTRDGELTVRTNVRRIEGKEADEYRFLDTFAALQLADELLSLARVPLDTIMCERAPNGLLFSVRDSSYPVWIPSKRLNVIDFWTRGVAIARGAVLALVAAEYKQRFTERALPPEEALAMTERLSWEPDRARGVLCPSDEEQCIARSWMLKKRSHAFELEHTR